MNTCIIPRWPQCGIFTTRSTNLWPALILLWCMTLNGQALPQMNLHRQVREIQAASLESTTDITILALRVEFTPDEDLSTTGNGTFLMDIDSLDVDSLLFDAFLVDPPPHDVTYFYAQLEALANYYQQVSRNQITFDMSSSLVYPSEGAGPIELGNPMSSYRSLVNDDSNDSLLVTLFAESITAAANSIEVADYDIVVIFHAGLGQDFSYPMPDPTPLDIPSAYIDLDMIEDALGTRGILLPDENLFDKPGIILPECQNHIYYDIVGDIFPDSHLDVQIGLTGTFALLSGYALGLPPLFDTDEGTTGVGVFGLMDLGSGNGQGVIPVPPTAWTRFFMGWEEVEELEGNVSLAARHLPAGKIGRITISNDEYFLIENRLNWLPGLPGVDIDSLRYRNRISQGSSGQYLLPHYFDYLVDSVGVDTVAGVITSVPNYDIGFPGSGLLIWHVDEARYNAGMQGINDDRNARAVALEEADGAVDIGFPTTAPFGNPDQGWLWDLWYAGNEGFFAANPDRGMGNAPLSFDSQSHPSTDLNSGAQSGIAVSMIGPPGELFTFKVSEEDITRLPEGSRLLGYNGERWLYQRGDSLFIDNLGTDEIFVDTLSSKQVYVVSESDPVLGDSSSAFWIMDTSGPGYTARRYQGNGAVSLDISDTVSVEWAYFNSGSLFIGVQNSDLPPSPDPTAIEYFHVDYKDSYPLIPSWGYLEDLDNRESIILCSSGADTIDPGPNLTWTCFPYPTLGDVDGDGLDEIVALPYRTDTYEILPVYQMVAVNYNGVAMDGFPLSGSYVPSPVLIANLMEDIQPELIVVESGDIVIYGPDGQPRLRLGLVAEPAELFLIPVGNDSIGLANGDRIHWFTPEEQNLQWITVDGRQSRSRYSLNDGIAKVAQPTVLDKSRVYNYPNPVTTGSTTIRFYTGIASKATIQIYTVDGLLVARTNINDLAINGYNEWRWDVDDNPSGLYYAVVTVEGEETLSQLVRIAVVR